ncbi:WD repeat-containing protein 46 [Armadillidium nasatum]|uniref:WD repeat-containing protein 46 n=1 Tax=Armadillidium nasatum TaxID=96803 RepID=A0A5N5STF5_9CRUS|nr:WD repeat-containing protein 46 [Armadillidium nasatum]
MDDNRPNKKTMKNPKNKFKKFNQHKFQDRHLVPLKLKKELTLHTSPKDRLKKPVDITSAKKGFEISLTEYGPYRFRYSQNGRNLVLCGRKGHIASFDWVTKKLHTEFNVMESVYDICYLHNEGMMAAAQKNWTYIYDNLGNEIHCLKHMHRALNLEFLQHFFLLCSSSNNGFLSWLDVSLGQEVLQTKTFKGMLNVMCQNPWNGVICCGHTNGTITMWTPNSKKAVLSMLCHPQAVRALSIDPSGKYIATGCVDRTLRIWDARNVGDPISSYRLPGGIDKLSFSQTNFLGVSSRNVVEVYRNVGIQEKCDLYMRHHSNNAVTDLITLDPLSIAQIDVPTLEEKLEAKKKLHWVKVPKVDIQPRYRMKGKSGSAQRFKRKSQMKEHEKREYLKFIKEKKETLGGNMTKEKVFQQPKQHLLDRFKPKKRKVD